MMDKNYAKHVLEDISSDNWRHVRHHFHKNYVRYWITAEERDAIIALLETKKKDGN
jgi:hypothetical protein